MKIGYFISEMGISGGIKVALQHVNILKKMNYDAILIAKTISDSWDLCEKIAVSKTENLDDIPNCDVYVGTHSSDVKYLFQRAKGKVVHLCQGYEPIKYISRIKKDFIPEKYEGKRVFSSFARLAEIIKYKRKIKKTQSVYSLPTIKAAVSKHLVELIEKNHKEKCFLIQNGVDHKIFYPDEKRSWGQDGVVRILSVGSTHVGFKGIRDSLSAIKVLKEKGIKVELTRVSPTHPTGEDLDGSIVDKFYRGLSEKEMANLYRNTDVLISPSLEVEGFGLPAIEALASGVPSILTEISSYKSFDEKRDFAYFVPTHRPDKIAEGVLVLMENKQFREKCVQRGLMVAKKYSLEITREHLVNFIKELG